jgi:hypothetical protein
MSASSVVLAEPVAGSRGTNVVWLWTTVMLPFALLTTNITLGLPVPETLPLVFAAIGLLLAWRRGVLLHPALLVLPCVLLFYGVLGLGGVRPVDGIRIVTAGIVLLTAAQLYPEGGIAKSCRIAIYALLVLRVVSLVIPGPMTSLYTVLGLRAADAYGGGAGVLFQEPSYLASAVFSMWGIARMGEETEPGGHPVRIDLACILLLLLSFSGSAALYAVVGATIVMRRRPMTLASVGLVLGAAFVFLLATQGSRLRLLFDAVSAIFENGGITAFMRMDSSSAHRLSMTVLSLVVASDSPFGILHLEMSDRAVAAVPEDPTGVLAVSQTLLGFFGNLQPNSIPLQMLVYGGWPLFAAFMILVLHAFHSLWRMRRRSVGSLVVAASLLFACVVQSTLTSPFPYMCIAVALYWQQRRGLSVARAPATVHEDLDRHHQPQ